MSLSSTAKVIVISCRTAATRADFSRAQSTFAWELISCIFGSVADIRTVQVTFHNANH